MIELLLSVLMVTIRINDTTYQENRQTSEVSEQDDEQSATVFSQTKTNILKRIYQCPYEDLIYKYFGDNGRVATAVFMAESGCNATSISHTNDYGVAQINQVHFQKIPSVKKVEWLMNPENNIKLAYEIYQKQGFKPWTAYINGAYIKFL